MYKLLTTAAVIMTVATPTLAWDGAKALTQKLDGIYSNLDGTSQFNTLQGEYKDNTPDGGGASTGKNGQLSNFYNLVDQGVSHITLTVDADFQITPVLNPGVSFTQISDAKDDLVNRVNYDLFADTDEGNYVTGTDYTDIKTDDYGFGTVEDPADGKSDDITTTVGNGGLAGVKINTLVTNTNKINEFLIAGTTSAKNITDFNAEFTAKEGVTSGVELSTGFFNHITGLNAATTLANDGTGFFNGIDLEGEAAQDVINNFAIPSYNSFDDIGNAGTGYFSSISNWANDIQTVTAGDKTGTVNTSGTITVVSAEAGSESISDGTDTFTWDADTNTFTK